MKYVIFVSFLQDNLTLLIGKLYHRVTDLELSIKERENKYKQLKRFCIDKFDELEKTLSDEARLLNARVDESEKTTSDFLRENEDTFFLQIKKLKDRMEQYEDTENNNNKRFFFLKINFLFYF